MKTDQTEFIYDKQNIDKLISRSKRVKVYHSDNQSIELNVAEICLTDTQILTFHPWINNRDINIPYNNCINVHINYLDIDLIVCLD